MLFHWELLSEGTVSDCVLTFAPSQPFALSSPNTIFDNPLKRFRGAALEQRFSRPPLPLSYGTVAAQLPWQPPASATKVAAGVAGYVMLRTSPSGGLHTLDELCDPSVLHGS